MGKVSTARTLNKIQIAERGQNTELESYRAILRGIVTDIDGPPPDAALDAKTAQDMRRAPFEFEQLLTPLGRMAYAILREARDSRRKLVEEWLDKNALRDRW